MNSGDLCFDYPMYGYKMHLNGDILFPNVDIIELEMQRELTGDEAKDFIKNDKKVSKEVDEINDMVLPYKTQPSGSGAGRKSFFKIKSKYRSKYV